MSATVEKTNDRYVLTCEGAQVRFCKLITLVRYCRMMHFQLQHNH